jgi:enoyl-CoA hydratase/carnithine racemase
MGINIKFINGVAEIKIDCLPANSVSFSDYLEKAEAIKAADTWAKTDYIIFKGSDSCAFCGGLDLKGFCASVVLKILALFCIVRQSFRWNRDCVLPPIEVLPVDDGYHIKQKYNMHLMKRLQPIAAETERCKPLCSFR